MVGLDPKAIKELKKLVFELKQSGCAILISTHIIDSIADLCDKVLIMKEASIIREVKKEDLAGTGKTLEELFFEATGVEQ
jgi:ABC-type multidrug transport system ATPase subunit